MAENFNKENLVFWCKTSFIDKLVCNAKGINYDTTLGTSLERELRYYFVINKQGKYKVISGIDIEPYKVKERGSKKFKRIYQPLKDCPIVDRDIAHTIQKYCEEVHGVNVII